jgi:WD40 repeat protein
MRQDRAWSLSTSKKKQQQQTSAMAAAGSNSAAATRVRLYELFVQIEREFETLYAENLSLQERLAKSEARHGQQEATAVASPAVAPVAAAHAPSSVKFLTSSSVAATKGLYAHKLRSQTNKLRAQTNRFMSNLKGQALNCAAVKRYSGHKDGVWEVSASRMGLPIIGTASADHTAMIWGMHSGRALLQYAGHSGSVNSIRFHPSKELVLTASGDGSVHIWQCAVHLSGESSAAARVASSEDELELSDRDPLDEESQFSVLRTPLRSLNGHGGAVVIAADWLPGGEQAVTAGEDLLE